MVYLWIPISLVIELSVILLMYARHNTKPDLHLVVVIVVSVVVLVVVVVVVESV